MDVIYLDSHEDEPAQQQFDTETTQPISISSKPFIDERCIFTLEKKEELDKLLRPKDARRKPIVVKKRKKKLPDGAIFCSVEEQLSYQ